MKITPEQVRHVARLARLDLPEEEVAPLTARLDAILNYIARLDELDTAGVVPTTHALAIRNAFREDAAGSPLDREAALANGPLHNGEAFVVPRVIG